ncbi:MAG: hypothetical protein E6K56_02525 [Ignavibacteria bacterium]|nr:MAG: hypothetical protein E6K56_02525 [Ignavibacteria bacterium]
MHEEWAVQYASGHNPASTGFAAIAVDPRDGSIYMTGATSADLYTYYETIKLSPRGDTLWTSVVQDREYSFDVAMAIALDSTGNVFVTGRMDYPCSRWQSNPAGLLN